MQKYTFRIHTTFIPPHGRLPRFKELPQDVQNTYADKASAEDIFFCHTADHPQMPVNGFIITAYAYAEDGVSAKELVYGTAKDEWIEVESEDPERYGTLRLRFRDIQASFADEEEELTGIEVYRDGMWKSLQADALLDEELYSLYVKLYGLSLETPPPSKHSVLVRALMAMCPSLRYGEADTLAVIALSHITNGIDENQRFPSAYFTENAGGWAAIPVTLASSLSAKEDWWTVRESYLSQQIRT